MAIAAAYMLNIHREKIKRVAIVDFDVHHGNGTQELLECLRKPGKLFSKKSHSTLFGTTK